MNDDSKIYVEAGQPATLNDGAGKLTDCATLQEAVLAWLALPSAQKIRATVVCPDRSHANADNAKASVVTPVTTSSHVAFEVGRSVARLSIAA